ncbi:MAG: TPM domain-containing protein [Sphingobium sp.]
MLRRLGLILALLAFAPAAWGQSFPALSGRVVDSANLLDATQEQALTQKLAAFENQSGRQLVVATIPNLQGYAIDDYGYRLGRAWGIGDKARNDGALLLVAPNERRVRIEAGYGLEGILTDAMAARIIRNAITPRFKAGDFPGGIDAGVDDMTKLLSLPPDQARALAATADRDSRQSDGGGMAALWIGLFVLFFVLLPLLSRIRGSKSYRGGRGPVVIWGPGLGGGSWGGGSSGGGWGGGGGFSGGGGSFGGGGASGGW